MTGSGQICPASSSGELPTISTPAVKNFSFFRYKGKDVTPEQVAQRLSLSVLTVRAWLRSGRLPGVKPGGKVWRVREADLDEYIRGLSPAGDGRGSSGNGRGLSGDGRATVTAGLGVSRL